MKRFINSKGWFQRILERLSSSGVADYLKQQGFDGYRVLAVDASVVVDLSGYGLGMRKMRICAIKKSKKTLKRLRTG